MTTDSPSLDVVLAGLSAGDHDAARRLHAKFVDPLIRLANQKLGRDLGPRADPESVAQSVFLSFFVRQKRGEYQFSNWAMVYGLLAHITFRKCLNRRRHHHAAKRDGGVLAPLEDWQATAGGPGPDDEAMVADLLAKALVGFDDEEREMIDNYLRGETPTRVAERMKCSKRTVQRAKAAFEERLLALLDAE
jgi:DNA-directed RNA polymerase specialized sigma24 family protein